MEQINLHLESLIYSSLMNEKLVHELRQYLKCGIRLSEKNLEFAEEFVELIGGILTDDFGEFISLLLSIESILFGANAFF